MQQALAWLSWPLGRPAADEVQLIALYGILLKLSAEVASFSLPDRPSSDQGFDEENSMFALDSKFLMM